MTMSPLRYLIIVFVLTALGLAVTAGFNMLADPYGFYRPQDRSIFPVKPAMSDHEAMAKRKIIAHTRPQTVILGSSRADYGIDPSHPAFEQPAYNAALKGIAMPELKAMIAHSLRHGAKHLVIGLDFFMFNAAMAPLPGFFAAGPAPVPISLSLSTLQDSLRTVAAQFLPHQADIAVSGQHGSGLLDRQAARQGHAAMFKDQEAVYLSRIYFPVPHRRFLFENGTGRDTWRDFEAGLALIQNSNARLTLFIAPVHARMLVLIRQSGLFSLYRDWKLRLAATAARHGYTVTDFTGLHPVAVELLPADKSGTMRYFWGGSHYKPVIGNAIVSDIFGDGRYAIPGFSGRSVTPQNLDRSHRDLIAFECARPKVVAAIRRAITDAGLQNHLIPSDTCP